MASSWCTHHVGEDGKKMCTVQLHMCTPGVYNVYGVIQALKRSLLFSRCQGPASSHRNQENTVSDSITRHQKRHIIDMSSSEATMMPVKGHNE